MLTRIDAMAQITLYNTRTRAKESFSPMHDGKPCMYVCGPTVYDRAHLGNARAMVVYDVLFRTLRHAYGMEHVTYVRNITDVDDKINAAAKARNIPIAELTEETTAAFHADMALLGCLPPTIEPRATGHIDDMITVIEKLIANQSAYAAEGHVLFAVNSCSSYGSLSNRSLEELEAGARVDPAPYKRNAGDFILWKPSAEDEPSWPSPWGAGRPGWHIECTAMSTRYLGNDFDIHGGGVDLVFPHHENETAQAVCAHTDSDYARFWVHNGFLNVNGEKMSKSLGNFITPGAIFDDAPSPRLYGEAVRYALLSAHYRKPLNWNDKLFADALAHVTRFYETAALSDSVEQGAPDAAVTDALAQDINTPAAFAALIASEKQARKDASHLPMFIASAKLCGLLQHHPAYILAELKDAAPDVSTADIAFIEQKIAERKAAKQNKDWPAADAARDALTAIGVTLTDNKDGTTDWTQA